MFKRIAILGLGWLGESLAESLNQKGNIISGSSSSVVKSKDLAHHPFYVGRIEVLTNEIKGDWETFMEEVEYLIINIPPRRIENIETIYPKQIEQIAKNTPKNVKVIFVSSTAVYGNSEISISEHVEAHPLIISPKQSCSIIALIRLIQSSL